MKNINYKTKIEIGNHISISFQLSFLQRLKLFFNKNLWVQIVTDQYKINSYQLYLNNPVLDWDLFELKNNE